jgi:hypothetical protein
MKTETEGGHVGELVHHIVEDLGAIVRDEMALVRDELGTSARHAMIDLGIVWLGASVALVGIAMLCLAGVIALAPVIPALWARLLVAAIACLAIGSMLAARFARRLAGDAPSFVVPAHEAKATLAGIGEAITTKEAHRHA